MYILVKKFVSLEGYMNDTIDVRTSVGLVQNGQEDKGSVANLLKMYKTATCFGCILKQIL